MAIAQGYEVALKQIHELFLNKQLKTDARVLDLHAQDGTTLKHLSLMMPSAILTGMETSPQHLESLKQSVPANIIEANPHEVMQYLPPHRQDLVLAHSLNASISMDALLEQIGLLTRSTGYLSWITTTYDAFPKSQQYLTDFMMQGSLLSRMVGHYYKSWTKHLSVIANQQEISTYLTRHQWDIVAHQRLEIPLVFHDMDTLVSFALTHTWFFNNLSVKILPHQFLFERLKRLFKKILVLPYEDHDVLDIVLSKKAL